MSDPREDALKESLRAMYAQAHYWEENGEAESALWYWLSELESILGEKLFYDDNPGLWHRED